MAFPAPLEDRIKLFLYDLRSFGSCSQAQERLLSDDGATFYMSRAYFSPDEVEQLRHSRSSDGRSLEQALEEVVKRKNDKGDYVICTSHDLAPVVQNVLNVPKGFDRKKHFKPLLKQFNAFWAKKQRS